MLFEVINDYILKYNNLPSVAAVDLSLQNKDGVFEDDYKKAKELLDILGAQPPETGTEWVLNASEAWCKEKALHNALMEAIQIMDDRSEKKDKRDKGMIPKLLMDALGVTFDPNIGHDYIEDANKRWEFYHKVEKKIPFDLEMFNAITNGGLPVKTLSIILAGTNVGKSLIMCHFAASALLQGYNVLYITLEMAEEKVARRIDANMMNVEIGDLQTLVQDTYNEKFQKIRDKVQKKLIIKEYPTASASSAHFRALLNELKLKKQFVPDIIFIDYLNIATSARIKHGNNVNSYTYVKAIAEELRGLAVEFVVPIVSATQTTRAGYGSSDPDLTDTSESFGLPATADFMFAATTDEELDKLGHMVIKQLKNRDNDVTSNRRFVIGVDRKKMKLYDVKDPQAVPTEQTAEEIYRTVGNGKKPGEKPLSAVQQAMKDWKFD